MTEPDRVFIIIPPHIRAREDLSLSEKMVAGAINGLTQKEGYCYASNSWIGNLIGVGESMVSKHISKLAKKGLVSLKVIKIKRDERTGLAGEKYGTIRHIYMYQIGQVDSPLGINCEPPLGINYQYKEKTEKKERGASALGGLSPRSAPPSSEESSWREFAVTDQIRIVAGTLGIQREQLSDGDIFAIYNRIKKNSGRDKVVEIAYDWLCKDIRAGKYTVDLHLYADYGDGMVVDQLPKTFKELNDRVEKALEKLKEVDSKKYQGYLDRAHKSTKKYDF